MADSYDINDRLEWTVVFLLEFDKKYDLSMKRPLNMSIRSHS